MNIAVIGCGNWGKNLVRTFDGLGALKIACDPDPKRLSAVPANIRTTHNYNDILTDDSINGVVIATPAVTHYEIAKKALLAGKDVMVEKPMSVSVDNGAELVRIAQANKRILLVGHLLEYHPGIVKLREIIKDGKLGNIKYVYSTRLNLGKFRDEENILWSFAPHDFAAILMLLGAVPESVSTQGGAYINKNIYDVTFTTLSFPNGVKAQVFVSWLYPYREQKLVVVGDNGMAVFEDTRPGSKLSIYGKAFGWVEGQPVPQPSIPVDIVVSQEEPLKLECMDFLECIEQRKDPKVSLSRALDTLRVLSSCQESLNLGGLPVAMNYTKLDYYVDPTSIVDSPSRVGKGTNIWHFCHVSRDADIGADCSLGQNVFIGQGVKVGNRVRIQNNVSVYAGVTIEDDVFLGPSCVFTNVKRPRAFASRHGDYDKTIVRRGATIGANTTIVCGVTIGEFAFVGAGAVVTKDVQPYSIVYGNPARDQGKVDKNGEPL